MAISTIFQALRRTPAARRRATRTQSTTLRLEPLEVRVVPTTVNEVYVATLYHNDLQRNADAGGLSYWSSALDNGADPAQVALGIDQSVEHRTDEVQGMYHGLLGWNPDPVGVAGWVAEFGSGATAADVEAGILGSSAFYNQAGNTPTGFLDAVYQQVLNRSVDPNGAAGWGAALAGGASPAAVALQIENSPEALADQVTNSYQTDLERQPDTSGLQYWVSAREQGTSQDVVEASLFSRETLQGIKDAVTGVPSFLKQGADAAANAYHKQVDQLGYTPALTIVPAPDATVGANSTVTYNFTALEGSTTATPAKDTFQVKNTGKNFSNLTFTVTSATIPAAGVNWLSVTPNQGRPLSQGQSLTCTIGVNPQGLTVIGLQHKFQGIITITDATGSATTINVNLTVTGVNQQLTGTYTAPYTATVFLNGFNGAATNLSGTVTILISGLTPIDGFPNRFSIQGQAKVTGAGAGGGNIEATLDNAILDTSNNQIYLGTIGDTKIGDGGNGVTFSQVALNSDNTITTTLELVRGGNDVGGSNNFTLTKK